MNALLDPLIRFAQDRLKKVGEFYPFGATMTAGGEVALAGAMGEDDHPASKDLIDLLTGAFRAQAEKGEIRACALCYDIKWRQVDSDPPTDAIAIAIEHRDEEPITVLQPYSKGMLGRWKFGDLVATRGERRVFGG